MCPKILVWGPASRSPLTSDLEKTMIVGRFTGEKHRLGAGVQKGEAPGPGGKETPDGWFLRGGKCCEGQARV